MAPGYEHNFVDINIEESDFKCSICLGVIKEATHGCDEHIFCKDCLQDYVKRKTSPSIPCPGGCAVLIKKDELQSNKIIDHMIWSLKCKCNNCEWIGELLNLEKHHTKVCKSKEKKVRPVSQFFGSSKLVDDQRQKLGEKSISLYNLTQAGVNADVPITKSRPNGTNECSSSKIDEFSALEAKWKQMKINKQNFDELHSVSNGQNQNHQQLQYTTGKENKRQPPTVKPKVPLKPKKSSTKPLEIKTSTPLTSNSLQFQLTKDKVELPGRVVDSIQKNLERNIPEFMPKTENSVGIKENLDRKTTGVISPNKNVDIDIYQTCNTSIPISVAMALLECNSDSLICDRCSRHVVDSCIVQMGKVWHPEHFCCSLCDRSLLNEVSVEDDSSKLVCENCYIKSHAPKCEKCEQPILGKYVSRMGKAWHPEHFCCSLCDKSLVNEMSIQEDGSFICEQCYIVQHAPKCFHCKQSILGPYVQKMDKTWHPEHFVCSLCGISLKDQRFAEENDKSICENCYIEKHAPKCAHCKESIRGVIVSEMGKTWHPHHFCCTHCDAPIELQNSFQVEDDQPVCNKCFIEKYAPKCAQCEQPVVGPSVQKSGKTWHPEHFCCSICNVSLRFQKYAEEDSEFLCEKCYLDRHAPKCGYCKQPIQGAFVKALGKSWHPNHLYCMRCNDPLQYHSFHEENDEILCEKCYRESHAPRCDRCTVAITGFGYKVLGADMRFCKDCFEDMS